MASTAGWLSATSAPQREEATSTPTCTSRSTPTEAATATATATGSSTGTTPGSPSARGCGGTPASLTVMSRWVWLSSTGRGSGSGTGGNSPARRAARCLRVSVGSLIAASITHRRWPVSWGRHRLFTGTAHLAPSVVGVTITPQASGNGPRVTYGGVVYPAEEIARGAAYELFSAEEAPGFEWAPRSGAALPWRRFVHATEVTVLPPVADPGDEAESPLLVPLHRERGWAYVQQLSQQPAAAGDPTLAAVRASAVIRRGTRMVKVLSARQLAGYVRGWLPHGFCYREHDVAHLRTPSATAVLRTDGAAGTDGADVTYALRWRAADPADYDVPVGGAHRGLTALAPRDRLGGAVLGTGFVPSSAQLVPEFVTRDFADLPMPANATLLAYPADGVEVVLYSYQAEQRGWLRMAGPQWRHLLAAVPGLSPTRSTCRPARRPAPPGWSATTPAASTRRWPTSRAGSGCWR